MRPLTLHGQWPIDHRPLTMHNRHLRRLGRKIFARGEGSRGEWCSGAGLERSSPARELEEFIQNPLLEIVAVSEVTADRFGRIASALKAKGTPIPSNDVWIAAQTMETGAELISFDKYFTQIDGLAFRLLRVSA